MSARYPDYIKKVKYYHHHDSYDGHSYYYFGKRPPGWIRRTVFDLHVATLYAIAARTERVCKETKSSRLARCKKIVEKELRALERIEQYQISKEVYDAAPAEYKFKINLSEIYY